MTTKNENSRESGTLIIENSTQRNVKRGLEELISAVWLDRDVKKNFAARNDSKLYRFRCPATRVFSVFNYLLTASLEHIILIKGPRAELRIPDDMSQTKSWVIKPLTRLSRKAAAVRRLELMKQGWEARGIRQSPRGIIHNLHGECRTFPRLVINQHLRRLTTSVSISSPIHQCSAPFPIKSFASKFFLLVKITVQLESGDFETNHLDSRNQNTFNARVITISGFMYEECASISWRRRRREKWAFTCLIPAQVS